MKRPANTRRVLEYSATAFAGFALAYLLVAFVILPDAVEVADVTVPGVVGLTQTDAQRRLTALGLEVTIGESRFSADAPKSTVVAQNPPAGATIAPGSGVTLDISAGQQRATIPSLVGLSRRDAEQELRDAALQLGQVTTQSSDSARGLVLASSPAEGQVVPQGTQVDLVVSSGPAELTMPDVVGHDVESARALLAQLGLSVAPVVYDPDATFPAGTVLAQSPAAGSAVAARTIVTLKVAGTR